MAVKGNITPKTVWGKIVLFLKEHRQVALHVACGDITDVTIEDGKLVVKLKDLAIYNLLTEGRREIENAIRWQGIDLALKIEYAPVEKSGQEKDIEKLNKLLGEYLIIK